MFGGLIPGASVCIPRDHCFSAYKWMSLSTSILHPHLDYFHNEPGTLFLKFRLAPKADM